ncbi:hypothetical protein DdX_22423 [Ditylenchus destructor]|uniref:Uncharacterized protein n=1 Tax=Ditylenchus destructor TaxID=166010 RepID=A0AAD4QQX1_9BILA|nr:hypothetical protein DdX_22423 [Ditylenchus destructor]
MSDSSMRFVHEGPGCAKLVQVREAFLVRAVPFESPFATLKKERSFYAGKDHSPVKSCFPVLSPVRLPVSFPGPSPFRQSNFGCSDYCTTTCHL